MEKGAVLGQEVHLLAPWKELVELGLVCKAKHDLHVVLFSLDEKLPILQSVHVVEEEIFAKLPAGQISQETVEEE